MIFKRLVFVVFLVCTTCSITAQGQEVDQFFKQNCSSCHWIGGGRLIGPDLKNVTERQDRDWLVRFILNPQAVIDAKDPYALKLKAEANGVIMLQASGINSKIANSLLDFIEAESKLDSSKYAGKTAAIAPYTEADASAGQELFAGAIHLKNDAPACISCHTVKATGSSLGGGLGPDLTNVINRLQGRAAISAWLSAPPTSTMKAVFKDKPLEEDEIKYLAAYFESVPHNKQYSFNTFIIWMSVIICWFCGSVVGMVLFSGIWSNRFRAVRRPLVNNFKVRGES